MRGFASIAIGDGAWIVVVIRADGDDDRVGVGQIVCSTSGVADANMIRDALVKCEMRTVPE